MGEALSGLDLPILVAILDRGVAGSASEVRRRLRALAPLVREDRRLLVQLRGLDRAWGGPLPELDPGRVLWSGTSDGALGEGFKAVHWPGWAQPPGPCPHRDQLDLISASVHDVAQVERAQSAGADLLVFAPVFAARCKASRPAGLAALAEICATSLRPVVALSGITPGRVGDCLAAGARGVAALTPFSSGDPVQAARELLAALTEAERSR